MQERFNEFTVLIARLNRLIYQLKTDEMSDFNLKSSHLSCIYYIYKEYSLTAKTLCDLCGEDKANISRAIKYLENNGYLIYGSKTQKRYQAPLVLTEKGKIVGKHISEKIYAILNVASTGLSNEDRMAMYRCLNIICENLKKICHKSSTTQKEEL